MALENQWGGSSSSSDFQLMMDDTTSNTPETARPLSIVGHGITGESDELRDAVTQDYQEFERGRIRTKRRTIRTAERIQRTGTLLYPNALMTPLLALAEKNNTQCDVNLYAKRLCGDAGESFAWVYETVRLNPPTPVNDLIPITETTTADFQSEFTAEEVFRLWEAGAFLNSDLNTALYAVSFTEEDCADCSETELAGLVAVGGDGSSGSIDIYYSEDRFATIKNEQHVGSAGDVGTSVYTEGNVILVGFTDDVDPASAAAGGTYYSSDLAASAPTVDSNLTEPIFGLGKFRGDFIAVGGTSSQGKVWTSPDGVTWTVQTTTNLPTSALTCVAVDRDNDVFYVGAANGDVIKGTYNGSSIVFSAVSVPGMPSSIDGIAVFDDDRFAVGGAASYGAESFNGGVTAISVTYPGNAAVSAIAGRQFRQMVGVATKLYGRDVLSNKQYEEVVPQNGATISGNYTSIASGDDNYFVAVTDAGEVVFIKPFHPFA